MTREDIEKAAYNFCEGEPHQTTHLARVMVEQINRVLWEAANTKCRLCRDGFRLELNGERGGYWHRLNHDTLGSCTSKNIHELRIKD